MYAITGATGQLGRLVIDKLLETVPANEVVATVRNPQKAADLSARGIEVREADYDRPDSLSSAFRGIEKLLLISSSEVNGRLPQHTAVIRAAVAAGVTLIAYTSMLRADTSAAKLAVEHKATEAVLAASGVPFVLLRNGWYTENHLLALQPALEHGVFIGAARNGRFSSAARADYAAAAAMVLTSVGQAGKIYELASDHAFTLAELAQKVSVQAGRPVVYNDLSQIEYMKALIGAGLPEPLAELLADADAVAADGGLFDDGRALSGIIGRPTTAMNDSVSKALRS